MSIEANSQPPVSFQFEDIAWKDRQPISDNEVWKRNKDFIALLIGKGTVINTIDTDVAHNLPRHYAINGVRVEYLPDWDFYRVGPDGGQTNLPIPETMNVLEEDLEKIGHYATARWQQAKQKSEL